MYLNVTKALRRDHCYHARVSHCCPLCCRTCRSQNDIAPPSACRRHRARGCVILCIIITVREGAPPPLPPTAAIIILTLALVNAFPAMQLVLYTRKCIHYAARQASIRSQPRGGRVGRWSSCNKGRASYFLMHTECLTTTSRSSM